MKKTTIVVFAFVAVTTVIGLVAQQANGQASKSPTLEARSTVI